MIRSYVVSTFLLGIFSFSAAGVVSAKPMVFPSEGQSKEQQEMDEFKCHKWAKEQTGLDPMAMASAPTQAPSQSGGGEVVRGGARGAALGAIGGAIADDAGKGAAIGAAVGGGGGALRKRRGRKQQEAQTQQIQAQNQANVQHYEKAWGLCMKGKGYEVG